MASNPTLNLKQVTALKPIFDTLNHNPIGDYHWDISGSGLFTRQIAFQLGPVLQPYRWVKTVARAMVILN